MNDIVVNNLTASPFVIAASQSSKSDSEINSILVAISNALYISDGTPLPGSEIASEKLMSPASDTVDITTSSR